MKILVINPGGTSTKIAVYEKEKEHFKTSIVHSGEDLSHFKTVFDEFNYRLTSIENILSENNYKLEDFTAFVGRGGLMRAVQGGTYPVTDSMIEDLKNQVNGEHASNLGSIIAKYLGDKVNKPAFVVDPVAVDELLETSRITGIQDLEYSSWFHALNHKAVCRLIAQKNNAKYEDLNFIVAHLGSGISIVAHEKGRMVDGSGGRTNGPFSPERSGALPTYPLIELCYSGKYTREEMVRKVSFSGGMYDYLGTKDMLEIEKKYLSHEDAKTNLIFDSFIYQTACEIAKYGATLCGKVDYIILTGGIAYSNIIAEKIKQRVSYLAPIEIVPGEMEMQALALGALRVLRGQENPKDYDKEANAMKRTVL